MTIPVEYERASDAFRRFVIDLRDTFELTTTNQAWGALLGVFAVFGRRLTLAQALTFAQALPPMLRAVFVTELHPRDVPLPFKDTDSLNREVADYHRDHQFEPPDAIAMTAAVLRRHVDEAALDRALRQLPEEASAFWGTTKR